MCGSTGAGGAGEPKGPGGGSASSGCLYGWWNFGGASAAVSIGAPVALLSTSPERDDTILVTDPFAD